MNDEERRYLLRLEYRALKAGDAHHRSARFFEFIDTWALAIPSLVTAFGATILAAVVFSTTPPTDGPRAAALIVAAVSTLLTGVRNKVGADGRAVGHQRSGVAYNGLRRKIAAAVASGAAGKSEVEELNALYDEAGQAAPIVPGWLWRRAQKHNLDAKPS